MISQTEERSEERALELTEKKANLLAFKIINFIIFALTLSSNIVIIFGLLEIVPFLEYPGLYYLLIDSPLRFLYIDILIVAFLKLIVDGYELVRYIIFLASKDNSKESALQRSGDFIGSKIIRIFSIVFTMILLIALEFSVVYTYLTIEFMPEAVGFIPFYLIFVPFVYIQVFITATAPHILKFSIEPRNNKYMGKFIAYSLTWISILILILTFKYGIFMFYFKVF
ncbi:MAG: hypothetical protein ACFFBP_00290 [Promethearchaeota archaeon]